MKRYRDKVGGVMRAATFIAEKVPGNIKFRVRKFRKPFPLVLQVMVGWRKLTVYNAIGSEEEVIVS
jgi:uncharacterized membrane protein (UPF0136 family)